LQGQVAGSCNAASEDDDYNERLAGEILKSLTVESVDIAGTIEPVEKSGVEKILGVGGFCRGNLFGELGQYRFESFHSGMLKPTRQRYQRSPYCHSNDLP